MRLVDVVCEACGHSIAVTPNAEARHVLCPLRRYGHRAPRYVTQTVDDATRADGSGARTRPVVPRSVRVRSST